jgi:uncharacterized membrane protein YgcG
MYRFNLLVAFLLCLCATAFGQEQERILRFHSDIVIDTTGRIEITEQIKVYVGGIDIKRGIERDIPLFRKDNYGKRVRMATNILAVLCNDEHAAYSTREFDNNTILRIGDADVLLKPGEYEYTIVYESFGHIGFFDGFDELYWNVTGNGWVFPIEQASAMISLPGNSSALKTERYTGKQGVAGKDCTVEDHGNTQKFKTTRMLDAGEGLTVAVAFPSDIVRRPPPPTKAQVFWYEHKYLICGLLGLLIFVIYWFYSARKLGKRPRKPVAIPTFKPPRNMSPADVSYLSSRNYLDGALTATFIEMAVNGAMTISCEKKKKYAFINKRDTERLRPVERAMHSSLFGGDSEKIEVNQKNYKRFSAADTYLKNSLTKQWNLKDYFSENKGYITAASLVFSAIIVLYCVFTFSNGGVIMAFCLMAPFIAIALLKLLSVVDYDYGCGVLVGIVGGSILLTIGALSLEFDETFAEKTHWLSAGFFALMPIVYFIYISRVSRLTPEGAQIASEIEGFRMYMKTAEEHRLNMLAPPEQTLELFEKLLPYALVLGVSNEWCKKFNNVLNRIDYHPEWYDSKDDLRKIGYAAAFAGLATSFGSSVSNANTDKTSYSSGSYSSGSSSWSSGSSGGGYSGGGGGGGGGRGW